MEDVIEVIEKVFKEYLPWMPRWVLPAIVLTVGAGFAVWAIIKVGKLVVETFKPLLYNAEQRKQVDHRRRFAKHISREIERLNGLEEWHEYRFAELEAEVEAEGERSVFRLFGFGRATRTGLRREKSLSRAIKRSRDRLIQLEGDPGSGKSVALRFVAQTLSERASRSRSTRSLVPIYINLKELSRPTDQTVDRSLIESFVLKTLNRVNDRDVEIYLEQEFANGIKEGTWLFLFDSFDEIPEILSSTEADSVIRTYADSVSDFLSGMNQCRGVIASRHFRGPGGSQRAQFRILPLTEKRRLDLVRKADLKQEAEDEVLAQLSMANAEIRDMIRNPMLLGLLCAHMKEGHAFPNNTHTLFATYIDTRLTRDRDRLMKRFKIEPETVRAIAESVAYSMAANVGLGLSPTREKLKEGFIKQGARITNDEEFNTALDALEFIKLGRSEVATAVGDSKPFTFAHRRFQEYFATCVALREPERVTPRDLIKDARWRETAVVMCQTQPLEALTPIIEESREALAAAIELIPQEVRVRADVDGAAPAERSVERRWFPWPPTALHLLSLLQDGFGRRVTELPDDIRNSAALVLRSASVNGGHFDRKWALEVSGILPVKILTELIRAAFNTGSQLLKDAAYRQVARLPEIPPDIASSIYKGLVKLALDGRLPSQRYSTYAHLARLDKAKQFIKAFYLLRWMPAIDLALHVVFILTAIAFMRMRSLDPVLVFGLLLLGGMSHFSLSRFHQLTGLVGWTAKAGIVFRCYLVFGALSFVMPPYSPARLDVDPPLAGLMILFSYALIWAPASLLAARTGQFTALGWWPIMPLVPFLIVAANIRPIFDKLVKTKALLIAAVFSSVVLVLGLGVFFLMSNLPDTVEANTSVTFLVFIYIVGFVGLLVTGVPWLTDRVRWIRRSKIYAEAVTVEGFMAALLEYSTPKLRLRVIQFIRKNGSLVATEEADNFLARLCLRIESDQAERKKLAERPLKNLISSFMRRERRSNGDGQDPFDGWFEKWAPRNNTLISHEFDILDELSLLLEQVRSKRQTCAA